MNKLLETINAILETCTGPAEAFVHLEDHKHELMVMQEECDCYLSMWKDAVRGISSKGPDMLSRLGFATFAESRQRLAAALKEADAMSYDAERSFEQMKRQELIVAAIELHIQSMGWEKPLTLDDFVAQPPEPPEECPPAYAPPAGFILLGNETGAVDNRPIPGRVFWDTATDDFCHNDTGLSMGRAFYRKWAERRHEFPVERTQ